MSALRLCVVAVFLAAAASATYSGAADACGVAPAMPFFGNSSVVCAKAKTCQEKFCSCIGAAAGTNFTCGAFTNGQPNCSVTANCVAVKIACINVAADDNAAGCSALKDLKMSNLAVAGGQLYNGSSAFKACKYEACKMVNATAQGGNCSLDFDTLCASPVKFIGAMQLKGNWAPFFADAAKKAKLLAALEKDLSKALKFVVKVLRMYLKTSRRAGESTLVVEFQASGVSGNNADLKAALAAVQADKSNTFFADTLAAYKTENNGASFTFVGIAAGSASSAVFAGSSTTGSKTTTTTTTTGGTPAPATTTSGTPAPDSGASSGAATQSLVAAVVVAVLGAMMF